MFPQYEQRRNVSVAPFVQPQLSAVAGASTSAVEHKQGLVGGPQGLKLLLIVCTSHRLKKKWFEKPRSFDFPVHFLLQKLLVLDRGCGGRLFLLRFHQLPAPGHCKMYLFFFLLPNEPRFYPPRSVTPVPESLQLFTSQAGSGIPIPLPSSVTNFVA